MHYSSPQVLGLPWADEGDDLLIQVQYGRPSIGRDGPFEEDGSGSLLLTLDEDQIETLTSKGQVMVELPIDWLTDRMAEQCAWVDR